MKNYFFFFILICFSSFCLPYLQADDTDLLNDALWQKLKAEGELRNHFKDNQLPQLFPAISYRDEALGKVLALKPSVGVELLLLSPVIRPHQSRVSERDFYSFSAISSLKGLHAFSPDKRKMDIFFMDAFCIGKPDDRNKQPDPVILPDTKRQIIFTRFEDQSMGKYNCSLTYLFEKNDQYNWVVIDSENTTTIWFWILPIADPGKARSFYFLSRVQDRYLFYGFTCIKTFNLFNLADSKKDDFYYRLVAIYRWMLMRLNES